MKKSNPPLNWLTISLWGICFFQPLLNFAQAIESPKQRVAVFMSWLANGDKNPFEGDCYEADGVDVTKIDVKCIQKYIKSIDAAGIFSTVYIKNLQKEFATKQAQIKKDGYAPGVEFDRYTLSQDPPSSKDLLFALKNSSTTITTGTKAKVTVNLKKPYNYTYIYSLDLEANKWKLSKIESK
jgi:hypothetical protein